MFDIKYWVEQKQGSSTIFISMIIFCIMAFLLTIFDMTRINIMKSEAKSNYKMAANMALTEYEPILFDEYGLLAGRESIEISDIVANSLDTAFYPNLKDDEIYLLDPVLDERSIKEANYKRFNFMEPKSYTLALEYNPYLTADFENPYNQIVRYMELRKEYLMLEPFLEKLNLLENVSKTSKVVEEKEAILESLKGTKQCKKKIIRAIDGMKIKKDGSYTIDEDFIRSLYYERKPSTKYYFDNDVKGAISYKDVSTDMIKNLDDFDEDDTEEIENYLEVLEKIEKIASNNYIVLGNIEQIVKDSKKVTSEIKIFKEKLEDLDDVMPTIKQDLIKEMDEVLDEISVENKGQDVDNLSVISEKIQKNDEIMKKTEMSRMKLKKNLENLKKTKEKKEEIEKKIKKIKKSINNIEKVREKATDPRVKKECESQINKYKKKKDKSEDKLKNIEKDQPKLIDEILTDEYIVNKEFKNYETDIFIDYSNMKLKKTDEDEYYKKKEEQENKNVWDIIKENFDLFDFVEQEDYDDLPSKEFEIEENCFDFLNINWEKIKKGIAEEIYINEYIIRMFNNVVSDSENESTSLSGYNICSSEDFGHKKPNEVEYIITGELDVGKSVSKITTYITAMRMACNVIYLLTNAEKKAEILGLATAAAGWWTAGVGIKIMAGVITIIWAGLESAVDVCMLYMGEEIPIIKTEETWHTSLGGNMDELVELFINKQLEKIEEPEEDKDEEDDLLSLDYQDYLRIILLISGNSKTKKVARIMDLVQINLNKIYENDLKLKDFFVGVNVNGVVNYETQYLPINKWKLKVGEINVGYE